MENIFEDFMRFENLLRRYLFWQKKDQGANPHQGQGRVLMLLKMQPEITQKQLTYLLDMRPQSLGELLTKLEKSGYITRTPSQQDRRVMVVKLTDEGREVASKMNTEPKETIFDQLNEEEQRQLSQLLNKLSDYMEEKLPEEALKGGLTDEKRRKILNEIRRGGFAGGFKGGPGFPDFPDGTHKNRGPRHHDNFFNHDEPNYFC